MTKLFILLIFSTVIRKQNVRHQNTLLFLSPHNTMLFFQLVYAFLPLRLKEITAVIGNQKYPNKVLTIDRSDLIHKNYKMVGVRRLEKDLMEKQLFRLQEAWNGGIVLKNENGRSFRHFDTLKFADSLEFSESAIHLIKTGTKYPGTFQIIADNQCLDAVENINKEIIVRFNDCNLEDSQIWGAFTEDQARSYLGMKILSQDRDERNLKRFVEKMHEMSFEQIIK